MWIALADAPFFTHGNNTITAGRSNRGRECIMPSDNKTLAMSTAEKSQAANGSRRQASTRNTGAAIITPALSR